MLKISRKKKEPQNHLGVTQISVTRKETKSSSKININKKWWAAAVASLLSTVVLTVHVDEALAVTNVKWHLKAELLTEKTTRKETR